MQEAELLSWEAAGKMLEVDECEDAQVAAREQTARVKLDSCIEAIRLVSFITALHTPSFLALMILAFLGTHP